MRTILLYIAISLMILLLLYSFIDMYKHNIVEGAVGEVMVEQTPPPLRELEYKEDPNLSKNPLYLATLNAANISYLKSKIDEVLLIRNELNETKGKVENNTILIKNINDSMKNLTTSLVPTQIQ